MPVTNLLNRTSDTMKGKRNYVRYCAGTGSPVGDTEMSSNKKFPVGSEYTDLSTGLMYIKDTASTWECSAKLQVSTTLLVDGAFFIAPKPCKVIGVRYVHSTAGSDGGAVNVQLTKDTGTGAPGAGTDLLTNNTNAGFNCKATANTVQVGTLVSTLATITLATGDRLSLDYAGTLTALAGVVVTVELEYV